MTSSATKQRRLARLEAFRKDGRWVCRDCIMNADVERKADWFVRDGLDWIGLCGDHLGNLVRHRNAPGPWNEFSGVGSTMQPPVPRRRSAPTAQPASSRPEPPRTAPKTPAPAPPTTDATPPETPKTPEPAPDPPPSKAPRPPGEQWPVPMDRIDELVSKVFGDGPQFPNLPTAKDQPLSTWLLVAPGAYGRLCEHLDSGRESTLFKFHLYRECRYLCDGGRGGPAVHGEEAIKIRCVIDNGIVRHRGLALGRLCRMCIKERNASRAACPQPTSDRIVGCPALGRFVKRLVRLEDAMAKVVDG